ncbi:MAG: hybrid sensor histidine kinase/response regulator [Myxococcaceae bacterium]
MPKGKVLYVDDEAANLSAFRYSFEDRFEIITVETGEEALAIMDREPIGVLLADQRMPRMSGSDLCALAKNKHPEVVRIIVSAYSDITAAVAAINNGQVNRYLIKPWREEELAEILTAALEAWQLGMLTRDLQTRLLKQEQQAATTYLLGRVLHELSNPMASLLTNLEWIDATMEDAGKKLGVSQSASMQDTLKELTLATHEAHLAAAEVVKRIQRFREGDTPVRRNAKARTDLKRAVELAAAMVRPEARHKAKLILELGDVPPVQADVSHLSQVLVNLMVNACEAIPAGQAEHHKVVVRTRVDNEKAIVEVEDTGSGIAEIHLPQVFDPFFTTKSKDVARGLGLAVVKETVESLGGEIRVTSAVGRGTCFTVTLPLA